MPKQDKYYVYYGKFVNGMFTVIGKKRTFLKIKEVSIKKKTFLIDYDKIVMRNGNKCILLLDIEGTQVSLQGANEEPASALLMHRVIKDQIAGQIVNALNTGMAISWIWLVVGLVSGIPLGIVIQLIIKLGVG